MVGGREMKSEDFAAIAALTTAGKSNKITSNTGIHLGFHTALCELNLVVMDTAVNCPG